jgi:hypothetical protein
MGYWVDCVDAFVACAKETTGDRVVLAPGRKARKYIGEGLAEIGHIDGRDFISARPCTSLTELPPKPQISISIKWR